MVKKTVLFVLMIASILFLRTNIPSKLDLTPAQNDANTNESTHISSLFDENIYESDQDNLIDALQPITVDVAVDIVENDTLNSSSSSSSGDAKWYYNTGTELPRRANYSGSYLLSKVRPGDLLYEAKGGFGITGHIAIIEDIFWSPTIGQYYIRVIEAIDKGVVRSVLDCDRIKDRQGKIYRVKNATAAQCSHAISFFISQLGKPYMIDLFSKNTSKDEKDWYCSELAYAAYYHEGFILEVNQGLFDEPGVTPRDIIRDNDTFLVSLASC